MITMKTDGVGGATFLSFRVATWGYSPMMVSSFLFLIPKSQLSVLSGWLYGYITCENKE